MRGRIIGSGRRVLPVAALAMLVLLAHAAFAFPFQEMIEPLFGDDSMTGLVWFFTGSAQLEDTQEPAEAADERAGDGARFDGSFCGCSEEDWFCICSWRWGQGVI